MIKIVSSSCGAFCRMVLIAAGILAFLPGLLMAQTRIEELVDLMSLEQLMSLEVHSTTFFDVPIEKTPGSLYIISPEILDFSYAESLADYLAYYVPGAHISEFSNKGALSSTRGVSGGTNNTTLFMLNSESLNTISGMSSNLNFPLLGYADRIEVLNGPCSLLHGSGALNGFVNIVHKNGTDHPGAFASIEAGLQDEQVRIETGYGTSGPALGDLYVYFGAVQADSLDTPARQAEAFDEPGFRASMYWRKDNFTLTALAQQEEFESGLTQAFLDIDEGYPRVKVENYALIPEIQFELSETEDLTLSLPVNYIEETQSSADQNGVNGDDKEYQIKGRILFRTTRLDNHRIALGGSATFYKKETQRQQYDVFSKSDKADSDALELVDVSLDLSEVMLSVFMEDTIQLTHYLSLFSGVRFDSVHDSDFTLKSSNGNETNIKLHGDYSEIFTPRLGLTWEISPQKVVKFMWQQGYNYPDLADRIRANDTNDLSTEKVESFELGYHQALAGSRGEINLNAYYNIFKDTVFQKFTENDSGQVRMSDDTVDRFVAAGFEATLIYNFFESTRVEASYAFSRPFDINGDDLAVNLTNGDGNDWVIYPAHTVKLNITHTFLADRLDITLGCLYNNNVSTTDAATGVEVTGSQDVFDHHRFIVNAAARYRLSENLAVTLRGKNILNSEVPATGYYFSMGYEDKNNLYTGSETYLKLDWKF